MLVAIVCCLRNDHAVFAPAAAGAAVLTGVAAAAAPPGGIGTLRVAIDPVVTLTQLFAPIAAARARAVVAARAAAAAAAAPAAQPTPVGRLHAPAVGAGVLGDAIFPVITHARGGGSRSRSTRHASCSGGPAAATKYVLYESSFHGLNQSCAFVCVYTFGLYVCC